MALTEAQRQARHRSQKPTTRYGKLSMTILTLTECRGKHAPIRDLTIACQNLINLRSEVGRWIAWASLIYKESAEKPDRVRKMESVHQALDIAIRQLHCLIDEIDPNDLDRWMKVLTEVVDGLGKMEVPKFRGR